VSVLMGLDDRERLDQLVAAATRLLAREGRQDAITALQATSSVGNVCGEPRIALLRS